MGCGNTPASLLDIVGKRVVIAVLAHVRSLLYDPWDYCSQRQCAAIELLRVLVS